MCLIHHHAENKWLLAEGRRNWGESRHEDALREVREETSYQAHIHLITMNVRAPPIDEKGHVPDKDLTESFMVTMRHLDGDDVDDVKIIWWYIAALNEEFVAQSAGEAEAEFTPEFFPLEEALKKVSFQNDRIVLQKAD